MATTGTWQNITPPAPLVDLSEFGVFAVYVDPKNPATIYVSAQKRGLLKSSDCGATWIHANTGTLGTALDLGSLAPIVHRPDDTNVIYTGSLYGTNGLFKSMNGGRDWAQIFPAEFAKRVPYGGFIGGIAMDPANPDHLLVTWHAPCNDPNIVVTPASVASCYAETQDGGTSWAMRNGLSTWQGGEGTWMYILDDNVWLFASSSNGMYRSSNQGASWTAVTGISVAHNGGQFYRLSNGRYFLGSANGVVTTTDNGASWALLPGSGSLIGGVVGDGTQIWSSAAYPYNAGQRPGAAQRYWTASISTPMSWMPLTSPTFESGAETLAYDATRRVLYSSNYWNGIWRVVIK